MKKIYLVLFTAAMATTFAACSKDDAATAITSYDEIVKAQPVPVEFGTYVSESATTRSGDTGNMNDANLQTSGFGVFAYYTKNSGYPDTNNSEYPNFMYNQQLQYVNGGTPASSYWWYTPIKYWPNDYNGNGGNVDGQPATGSASDRLSFFAYAPYVTVTQDNSNATLVANASNTSSGIIGLSGNAAEADPKVTYKAADDNTIGSAVDLLWGVTPATYSYETAANDNFDLSAKAGLPLKNLVKQKIGGKVNFAFKHALVGLNLTAQGAYNEETPGANTLIPDATFIHIESVVIKSSNLNESGVLNLNNTVANTPEWSNLTASANVNTFTLNRADIISNLRYTSGLVVEAINSGVGRNAAGNAAIAKPQQVIDGNIDNADYSSATYNKVFLLLPTTAATTFTVTVTYYVRTKDANLKGGYSEVKNVITKNLTINDPGDVTYALAGNKVYTINMIFGLTNVNFEASVADWGGNSKSDVYLPQNTPMP